MSFTEQQVIEINRRAAMRCPHHVRKMHSCPICARISVELIAPLNAVPLAVADKRIRQSDKPILNKLESEWFAILNAQFPNYPRPRAQAKTYVIARGCRYTPDITVSLWPDIDDSGNTLGYAKETAFEIKGKKMWDDSIVKLKVAASVWPEVNWWLCDKVDGKWRRQKVI